MEEKPQLCNMPLLFGTASLEYTKRNLASQFPLLALPSLTHVVHPLGMMDNALDPL
jgi:hypothetical protein